MRTYRPGGRGGKMLTPSQVSEVLFAFDRDKLRRDAGVASGIANFPTDNRIAAVESVAAAEADAREALQEAGRSSNGSSVIGAGIATGGETPADRLADTKSRLHDTIRRYEAARAHRESLQAAAQVRNPNVVFYGPHRAVESSSLTPAPTSPVGPAPTLMPAPSTPFQPPVGPAPPLPAMPAPSAPMSLVGGPGGGAAPVNTLSHEEAVSIITGDVDSLVLAQEAMNVLESGMPLTGQQTLQLQDAAIPNTYEMIEEMIDLHLAELNRFYPNFERY